MPAASPGRTPPRIGKADGDSPSVRPTPVPLPPLQPLSRPRPGASSASASAGRPTASDVDADAVVGQFERHALHEPDEAELRGRMDSKPRDAGAGGVRGEKENRAAGARLDHALGGEPAAHERRLEIAPQRFIPQCTGFRFEQRAARHGQARDDQDVEPTEAVDGLLNDGAGRSVVGEVARHREGAAERR